MDYGLEKLIRSTASARTKIIIASVSMIVALIALASLSAPDFFDVSVFGVTSFLQMVWDQVSSPSPPLPAGDLTMRLVRYWSFHIVEMEFPRLREVA